MSTFYFHQPSLFSNNLDEKPKIITEIDRLAVWAKESRVAKFKPYEQKNDNDQYPPRLSLGQINRITCEYPFYLPLEVQILYQRGNGCLPIGLDTNTNWDSFDNYFDFTFPNTLRHPLLRWSTTSGDPPNAFYLDYEGVEPCWFPICSTGEGQFVVVGSKVQKETSPILFIGDDQSGSVVWWNSLTDIFSKELEHLG